MLDTVAHPLFARMDRRGFLEGRPFPVIVLDDFLPDDLARSVHDESVRHGEFVKSNDYIFAKNKFELNDLDRIGSGCARLKKLLLSEDFRQALSAMYGKQIFVDPAFAGGGLHRGGEGSYLDMHADFNLHPVRRNWLRELNILLYLNPDWEAPHGGALEMINEHTGERASIAPLYNRLVIMLTKDHTLHGYKPIAFPDGKFRMSIASYAYSMIEEGRSDLRTTTKWVIDASQPWHKRLIARVTPRLVMWKQALLGGRTGRNQ